MRRSWLFISSTLLNSTGAGLLMSFLILYFLATTSLTVGAVGIASSVGRAVAAVVPLVISKALDRWGSRTVAAIGDALAAIGFLLCLVVTNVEGIALTQFIIAVGSNLFWTSSRGLVRLASREKNIPTWFGFFASIRNVGIGMGVVITSAAFSTGQIWLLHAVVILSGVLYLMSSVCLMAWSPAPLDVHADQTPQPLPTTKSKPVLGPAFRGLMVLNSTLVFASMVLSVLLIVYVTNRLGLSAAFAGGLIVANTVIVALAGTPVAHIAGRWNPVSCIVAGMVLNIMAYVSFIAAFTVRADSVLCMLAAAAAVLLLTMAEMLALPIANSLAVTLSPPVNDGRHQGAFQSTWTLGTVISPALLGGLLDRSSVAPWLVLIVVTVVCATVGLWQFRSDQSRSTTQDINEVSAV